MNWISFSTHAYLPVRGKIRDKGRVRSPTTKDLWVSSSRFHLSSQYIVIVPYPLYLTHAGAQSMLRASFASKICMPSSIFCGIVLHFCTVSLTVFFSVIVQLELKRCGLYQRVLLDSCLRQPGLRYSPESRRSSLEEASRRNPGVLLIV